MRIKLVSIFVEDQEKGLRFYTDVLGFVKKHDVPAGGARWITVVSPEGPGDVELVLEPNGNPTAKTFQSELFQQGIPITAFEVDDVDTEVARLEAKKVAITMPPTQMGPVKLAMFSDTCGNLIQIYQPIQSGN